MDPELETVKIYRLSDEGYARPTELAREANETLSTPLLPEFQVPLGELFG